MPLPPPITSRSNTRVKALRAAFNGKASQPGELIAIEGMTLLDEALRSHVHIETIYVREDSEPQLPPALSVARPGSILVLRAEVFDSAVDTASPQGVAALVAIPDLRPKDSERSTGVILILEAMQDPGNLGTLLRTAEAFGVSRVLLTPETVNPWNPKTVRASAGSVFRVPTERMPLAEAKSSMTDHGVRLFAAVTQAAAAIACMEADLAGPCALMIGNEGAGLSEAALALADERIHIPCRTESLNAAAAGTTLLYEAMRQRLAKSILASSARESA